MVVAAKASILARSLPSRPGLPETTSRSSFGWFAGVKDRCTDTRPQSSTMSTRSFGHRERSGSALSLRGDQIAVDATSSMSRFPRGLARVPAGVQRRELRKIQRRELRDAVLVHRQVLERRERCPERLGWGQALERAVVALDRCEGGVGAELGQLRQRQVALGTIKIADSGTIIALAECSLARALVAVICGDKESRYKRRTARRGVSCKICDRDENP